TLVGGIAGSLAGVQSIEGGNRRSRRGCRHSEEYRPLARRLGPARRLTAPRCADVRPTAAEDRRAARRADDAPRRGTQDDALSTHADATRLLSTRPAGAGNGRSVWPAPPLPCANRSAVSDGAAQGAAAGRL